MKRIVILTGLFLCTALLPIMGQTDVTSKIDNPDFEARFAAWNNNGMLFQTNASFFRKNGFVYMEKWVNQGSKVGSGFNISQELVDLEPGTYTLVAGAHNIQQGKTETKQTGAYLYAGDEQVEVSDSADYSVVFTVVNGTTEIGFKTVSATGNWVCVDNFRLYYNGIVKDSINLELQKLITEAEGVLGDGATADELQTAIDNTKSLLTADGDYETAAKALIRATLNYRISNATGNAPKVTTYEFVPTGVTIALGRSTISGSGIKERGFCWSTEPEPTVLDNRTTRYYSNNGNIYHMDHLQPATIYYVRAYAMTSGYKVGYGDVVKIATSPESNMTTWYDYAGDEQQNYRIASAVKEVEWLYHHLTNVRSFSLKVHYSYGSGANGGTADCSYGGWMRVSQNTPYQQTGTILHETNHGVGVGTTSEWKNNSDLRSNTTSGLWLGPRANMMVRFLENNASATLNGDGTHMWPYGINGAHEDVYNPESTILYYGNIMTTHALHHDGLICSSGVGFATPTYVFEQDDNKKYYIKSEDTNSTTFLTMTASGTLSMQQYDAANADNFAWYITYDPNTCYYIFQNAGTGKYLTYSTSIKAAVKTALSTNEKFHLLPARESTTMGDFTGTGYWITKGSNVALQAETSNTSTQSLDFSNNATNQRWLFLTEEQLSTYNEEAVGVILDKLNGLLSNAQNLVETPHTTKDEGTDLEETDKVLTATIDEINTAKAEYTSTLEVSNAVSTLQEAMFSFLDATTPSDIAHPFDVTFALTNPGFDSSSEGWSETTTNKYSCCEFYEKSFDFNQTTTLKMPAGTYELKVQAFQRPGSYSDTYTDFVTNGTNKVNSQIYLKTKYVKVKNIWEDAQDKSLGGLSKSVNGKYVPDNMLAASKWFAAGWYENSAVTKTATKAVMKMGIRSTSYSSAYWTIFDNFRLYYYGSYSLSDVTPVEDIMEVAEPGKATYYDLSGRRVLNPTRGIYLHNGKKILIK